MRKLIRLLSLVAIAVALAVPVTASGYSHVHTYCSLWEKTATHHWHVADCGHDEKGAFGTHVNTIGGDYLCDVCGYDMAIHVSGVALNQYSADLRCGDMLSLVAILSPLNATIRKATWSSSDKSVATVSDEGLVTAIAEGNAEITVTTKDGGRTATCSVTVTNVQTYIAVTGVSLKSETAIVVGTAEQLTADVSPINATNKSVIWSTSDVTVATVSATGLVTALKEGTATITVTTVDGNKSATCTVTVVAATVNPIPVDSVIITGAPETMNVDEVVTLTATVLPANATDKTVTWSTSDDNLATVDSSGKVTAISAGEVKITATAGDKSDTVTITIIVPIESVSISGAPEFMNVDEVIILVANIFPQDATDKTVTWSSSDNNLAKVDSNGKVTAISAGEVKITATAGGVSQTVTITIVVPVESVTISNAPEFMNVDEVITLVANIFPQDATDKTVTWSSSDDNLAKVDNGKVTAKSAGEVRITATAGGKSATVAITIVVPVESVTITNAPETMNVEEVVTLTATVNPENATDKTVTWYTSDETKATVDNGKVTAISAGAVKITATAGGKNATVTINIVIPTEGLTDEQIASARARLDELRDYYIGDDGIYKRNEEVIQSIYDVVGFNGCETISDLNEVIAKFQSDVQALGLDTDAEIKAKADEILEAIAELADKYRTNGEQFDTLYTDYENHYATAKSIADVVEYYEGNPEKGAKSFAERLAEIQSDLDIYKNNAIKYNLKDSWQDFYTEMQLGEIDGFESIEDVVKQLREDVIDAILAAESEDEVDELLSEFEDSLFDLLHPADDGISGYFDEKLAALRSYAAQIKEELDSTADASLIDDIDAALEEGVNAFMALGENKTREQIDWVYESAEKAIAIAVAVNKLNKAWAVNSSAFDSRVEAAELTAHFDVAGEGEKVTAVKNEIAGIKGDFNAYYTGKEDCILNATDRADAEAKADEYVRQIAQNAADMAERIEGIISALLNWEFDITVVGETPLTVSAKVKYGGTVILSGEETDTQTFWYTQPDFSGMQYDFDTPVYDDITLYAKVVRRDYDEFDWSELPESIGDGQVITQDKMTGSNAFLKVLATSNKKNSVNYREPDNDDEYFIELYGAALQVVFKGTGTLIVKVRSSGGNYYSAFAVKDSQGNYVAVTDDSLTKNVIKPTDANIYVVTGSAYNELTFNVTQPGSYTLCQVGADELSDDGGINGLKELVRISEIIKDDYYVVGSLVSGEQGAVAANAEIGDDLYVIYFSPKKRMPILDKSYRQEYN